MNDRNARIPFVRPQAAALLLVVTAASGCRSGSPHAEPSTSSAPADATASVSSPAPSSPLPTPTTHSPTPTARPSAPAVGVPDRAAIRRILARTVLDPSTHFVIDRRPVTTSDRHGGTLTAVVGQHYPTADAKGQLVFFWHGTRFLGWDAITETDAVQDLTAGPGYFRITYSHYAPQDPECCPSLAPAAVTYTWQDDGRLVASGTRPQHGKPIRVKLKP